MLIAGRLKKDVAFAWMEQNKDPFCISILTTHLVLHFGIKDGLSIADIKTFLADFPKVALLPEDYATGLDILRDLDHEDALQLAMALRVGCSSIVTLEQKFARTYGDKMQFITL